MIVVDLIRTLQDADGNAEVRIATQVWIKPISHGVADIVTSSSGCPLGMDETCTESVVHLVIDNYDSKYVGKEIFE